MASVGLGEKGGSQEECLALLDDAAAQVWKGQQDLVLGTTVVIAGAVVLTGSSLTANPLTTLFGGGLVISGLATTGVAGVYRNGGMDALRSMGLGAYADDLVGQATLGQLFLGPDTYTPPSQGPQRSVCIPLIG